MFPNGKSVLLKVGTRAAGVLGLTTPELVTMADSNDDGGWSERDEAELSLRGTPSNSLSVESVL